MKCEHCGKNEVSFLYQSNINGHVEEKHLCAQCAEKLGYSQRVAAQSPRRAPSTTAFSTTAFSTTASLTISPPFWAG